jgi:hypothetical protein
MESRLGKTRYTAFPVFHRTLAGKLHKVAGFRRAMSPQGSKGLPASHFKGQEKEELNNDKEDEEDNEGEEWENRFSFSSPIVSIFFIVVSLFFKGQEERN